jgi:hypothetical protein
MIGLSNRIKLKQIQANGNLKIIWKINQMKMTIKPPIITKIKITRTIKIKIEIKTLIIMSKTNKKLQPMFLLW